MLLFSWVPHMDETSLIVKISDSVDPFIILDYKGWCLINSMKTSKNFHAKGRIFGGHFCSSITRLMSVATKPLFTGNGVDTLKQKEFSFAKFPCNLLDHSCCKTSAEVYKGFIKYIIRSNNIRKYHSSCKIVQFASWRSLIALLCVLKRKPFGRCHVFVSVGNSLLFRCFKLFPVTKCYMLPN